MRKRYCHLVHTRNDKGRLSIYVGNEYWTKRGAYRAAREKDKLSEISPFFVFTTVERIKKGTPDPGKYIQEP